MRILIVTQIFRPEMGAQSNRLYPIVRQLALAGHEVFVATGMPNYPEGIVFPAYQGKRTLKEQTDGYTIFRTACYTAPRNKSKWSQLRSYLSFMPAALRSGMRAGKIDLVFVTSPPLFSAIPAILLASLRRARLVLDIRDLWPDEIVACGGATADSTPVRVMKALERLSYRAATAITCTTQSFIDTLLERGVPRDKTILIPNGADLQIFQPLSPHNPIVAEYPFGDRFVVMYSGVLGIKHGLEVVFEAARLLRDEKNILFFFLGSGARREALQEIANRQGLSNVIFGGERKVEDIPSLLARADICLTALLPDPYLEKIITVKVFEYLACAKPVVGAVTGETANLLASSGAGIVVSPNDGVGLAKGIRELYDDPARRFVMGRLGRRYVAENFSRVVWATRLEQKLCEVGTKAIEASPPATTARFRSPLPFWLKRSGQTQ